jgi:RNA-binding protein 39
MTDQVLPSQPSPGFEQPQDDYNPEEPKEDDSETRSVFVSQLAARLTARDLGYFFEDKLGEGTVLDSRIVTDRISRRSKGYDLLPYKMGTSLTTVQYRLRGVPDSRPR